MKKENESKNVGGQLRRRMKRKCRKERKNESKNEERKKIDEEHIYNRDRGVCKYTDRQTH